MKALTDKVSVGGQIEPADLERLAAAGFNTVICNRPDAEVPAHISANALSEKAAELGLRFFYVPVSMNFNNALIEQGQLAYSEAGKVYAYCGSGMRSAFLWAFVKAPTLGLKQTLDAIEAAGYNFMALEGPLEDYLDSLSGDDG